MNHENKLSRRWLLGAGPAALAEAGLLTAPVAKASTAKQEIHEPLADFKYSLEPSTGWTGPGGSAKEVTVDELPISKSIAGVSMRLLTLQPGALRELHWHPNADEWDFVISGSAEIGIFGSHARSKVMQFQEGDVAFINQGFGHYIKNTGDAPLKMIVLLNSPFYQEVSLSGWLGANPAGLVADNLNLSPAAVEKLPTSIRGIITERVAQVYQYEHRRN